MNTFEKMNEILPGLRVIMAQLEERVHGRI